MDDGDMICCDEHFPLFGLLWNDNIDSVSNDVDRWMILWSSLWANHHSTLLCIYLVRLHSWFAEYIANIATDCSTLDMYSKSELILECEINCSQLCRFVQEKWCQSIVIDVMVMTMMVMTVVFIVIINGLLVGHTWNRYMTLYKYSWTCSLNPLWVCDIDNC